MGIIPFSQPAVQKEFFFNKTHIPGDIQVYLSPEKEGTRIAPRSLGKGDLM
jgi:hypothetical protein